ncbi:MAG: ORF6N domain-containing protein [Ignavibacteria bacterium]|nr:ORF6N domain-containing protein [Ignavibacteria bacterium]
MLDRNLAELYGVSTKVLNQAVKRNSERFTTDFMFILTKSEKDELVTNCDRFNSLKHSTVLPFAFTEYGALMLASVLNSQRAIEASIFVVQAFVKLREILSTHKELAQKLKELEYKIETHDEQVTAIFAKNVTLYPQSANVYDSLVETYEKAGQLLLANQNYEKAYLRAKEINHPNLQIYKQNYDRTQNKEIK